MTHKPGDLLTKVGLGLSIVGLVMMLVGAVGKCSNGQRADLPALTETTHTIAARFYINTDIGDVYGLRSDTGQVCYIDQDEWIHRAFLGQPQACLWQDSKATP